MYKLNVINNKPEEKIFGLSVSKFKTYESCSKKYQFCYILKFPRIEQDFQIFGKLVHKVLEEFHLQRLAGNIDPDNVLMTHSFKVAKEEYKDKATKEQLEETKKICMDYLKHLDAQRILKTEPKIIFAEKAFNFVIDDLILLNGYIDRVQIDPDGVMRVCDYKTSDLFDKDDLLRKDYSKSKKFKRYKKDIFQLQTYAYVMFESNPDLNMDKIRCSYVMARHNFEEIVVEFTREQAYEIKDIYLNAFKDISNEKLFRSKTTPLCFFCDFKEHCEDGREYLGLNIKKFGETEW